MAAVFFPPSFVPVAPFWCCLRPPPPSPFLPHSSFVQVFGRVTAGMDTVRRIETIKTTKSDYPLEEVKIVSISIS